MMSAAVLTSLIAALAATQLRETAPVSVTAKLASRQPAHRATDSVRTIRAARRAQEQFEALRRANLPFKPGSPRHPCDLQVGRLCYWHDDGYSSPPIPEPERIARGRERLLHTLAEAERSLRGDEWIVGQRVRYLIEAGKERDAIEAAAECGSTPWWCTALAGLALHRAGEYPSADSAFDAALAAMPSDLRCRWADISMFVDGEPGRRYRRLPCSDRVAFERRFWWLSQPLFGQAGNDVRTEFFARRTMSRLEQQARSAYNLSWGPDVEELLMRFGWPTWWTRDHSSSVSAPGPPTIVGHEPTPSFFFHPAARLLDTRVADARTDDWEPRARLPAARYAPAYAASFSDLEAQIAVFRRGDSALVVATYALPKDSLFDDGLTEAVLAVGRDESTPMTVVRRPGIAGRIEPLIARVSWGAMLVSIETKASKRRGVARARFGIRPNDDHRRGTSGRLALSDILVYRAVDSLAGSLDDAARHALGTDRIPRWERVGIYWEIYGVRAAGEPLSVTLTVERIDVGWRTRAAERLRLATKATPLRVRWQEVPKRDSGIASRAITIDVATLPTGRYRMQLAVVADDGSTATSERIVELVRQR